MSSGARTPRRSRALRAARRSEVRRGEVPSWSAWVAWLRRRERKALPNLLWARLTIFHVQGNGGWAARSTFKVELPPVPTASHQGARLSVIRVCSRARRRSSRRSPSAVRAAKPSSALRHHVGPVRPPGAPVPTLLRLWPWRSGHKRRRQPGRPGASRPSVHRACQPLPAPAACFRLASPHGSPVWASVIRRLAQPSLRRRRVASSAPRPWRALQRGRPWHRPPSRVRPGSR